MALLQKRNTSNSKEDIPTKRTCITLSFAQNHKNMNKNYN